MKLSVDEMKLICGFLEEMMDNVTQHAEGCAAIDDDGNATGKPCNALDDEAHDGYILECEIDGADLVDHVGLQISQLKKDIENA